jgi:two-component system, chemotaxis family, CheB/CheR fusion protein
MVDSGEDRSAVEERQLPEGEGRQHPCPVVAIGASAGGLEAYQEFLEATPPDTGMSFILVQHLSPKHDTLMPELLAQHTSMPVQLVDGETVLEPNRVYVVPPDAIPAVDECVLMVTRPARRRGRRSPIDSLFRSLAEDQGDDAAGIILSGAGTDGALGLKAIQEQGGLTLVQAPTTARYDSMPRSAILTGAADAVLPVREMPARLIEHRNQLFNRRHGRGPEGFRGEIGDHLGKICAILRRTTGHDFRRYKQNTLVRRVRRRMDELRSESVPAYVELLGRGAQEAEQLFQDLLIGVTHFFRDTEAFEALAEKVFPSLFEGKDADSQVRVWVPGCATGEEAYSLAILLREHLDRLETRPQILILATDIDAQALEMARQGLYPESVASQMSPGRLERFFVKQGNMYQAAREIRELCLFSVHNLITDPPFSRLDLISCRNLLIYLESDLQKKVIPLFHYALRPGGFLFLGPSENVGGKPELFRTIDKRLRIFQSRDTVVRPPVSFPLTDRVRFGLRQGEDLHRRPAGREVARAFENVLLESFAPACVVVNEQGDIVYFSPRTGRYLEPPAGAPSLNVLDMARKGLRLDLRTALHKVVSTRTPVTHEDLLFEADGTAQRINLIVRPMPEVGEEAGLFMVVFQEVMPAREPHGDEVGEHTRSEAAEDRTVRRLEAELRATRDHLQATLEELESSNEELVSSNEELLSMNEELQSANEELQTSKEELQSVNEELESVNAELKKKLHELDRANSDLQNLFASTQIATVFVDRELRVQRFTPAATEVFRLIDGDVGRPISDIAPRFINGKLTQDIRDVLRTLAPRERQVYAADDCCWYILRILPYRTLDDMIDGVVLTCIDVTDLKDAQEQGARLAAIVESSHDAILSKSLDGVITSWNVGAERLYGYTAREAVGRPISFLFPRDRMKELDTIDDKVRSGEGITPFETMRVRKDGTLIHVLVTVSPVRDATGRVVGASSIARDISDRKRAEEAVRSSEERYRSLVQAMSSVVWTTDAGGRFVELQPSWEEYTGQPWEEHRGEGWAAVIHPDDRERVEALWREALERKDRYRSEGRIWSAAGGEYRHFVARGVPLLNPDGSVREWVGTVTDVEDRWRAEEALREEARRKDEFLAMLGHELRNPLAPIRNCLHILEQPNVTDEQRGRARETIERQVLHLTRLVDDLLDISRISRGKIFLRRQRLDLVQSVRAAVEDQRGELEGHGITLALELPDRPLWVDGDPTRLSQSLSNLLHNAGKFTEPGGRITVGVAEEAESGTVAVYVQDTGIGIAPEMLARLFEPFSQADGSPDRNRGGLGLGLALVRALIELHGGTVEAESPGPGRGSEFRLHLPLQAEGEDAMAESEEPEWTALAAREGRPRRCLIIEDNVDAAESMGLLLELAGHEVALATDGPSGLEKARQLRPEVVLCDIGLPGGMDGHAVARAFRADPDLASACLIALTGYGQEEDRRRALDAGFDAHLTKPADLERLKRLVEECGPVP